MCEGKIEKPLAESPAYAQSFGYVCVQGRAWAITESDELYLKEMPQRGNIVFEATRAIYSVFLLPQGNTSARILGHDAWLSRVLTTGSPGNSQPRTL